MDVSSVFSENWECHKEGVDSNSKNGEEGNDGSPSNKDKKGNSIESSDCETNIRKVSTEFIENL